MFDSFPVFPDVHSDAPGVLTELQPHTLDKIGQKMQIRSRRKSYIQTEKSGSAVSSKPDTVSIL